MDWLTLLKTTGPLTTLVVAIILAAWRMLNEKDRIIAAKDAEIERITTAKDAEISRISDARIEAERSSADRLIGIVREFNSLQQEQTLTLQALAARLKSDRPPRS